MSKILSAIVGITVGLLVTAMALPVRASYCEYPIAPPPYCLGYAPSAPSGWSYCSAGYVPASGEVALFDQPNFAGHCIKRAANFDQASLGDFDSTWYVQSYKTRATWYLQLWDGTSYTGSTSIPASGDYASAPSWHVSSLKARN